MTQGACGQRTRGKGGPEAGGDRGEPDQGSFVDMYENDLSYKDKKSLVCKYGMRNAYKLAYDFYTISCKHTP